MEEMNFKKSDDTITSTTTSTAYNINYNCIHRLPCGYCKLLEKCCPMYYSNIPMYNPYVVTCETKGNM